VSDSSIEIAEISAPTVPLQRSGESRRQRWFEVGLVLLVAFGGAFLNAADLLHKGPAGFPQVSNARWAVGTIQEITALILLGYVLSRRGLRLRNLGFSWRVRDVGVGFLDAGTCFATYLLGSIVVHLLHYGIYGYVATGPSGRDFFAHPPVAAIPFFLLNPFFEEIIVRAYLMTEILELTGSAKAAVGASVVVQSGYHLYYGWVGALSLSFIFLVLAIYFVRSRRVVPVIVAHALFDIAGFISLL